MRNLKIICMGFLLLGALAGIARAQTVLTVNAAPIEGNITPAGDEDWYQFTITGQDYFYIETWVSPDYGTLGTSFIELRGPNDSNILITSDTSSGLGSGSLIYRNLTPGTYYVKVRAGYAMYTGTYHINVVKAKPMPLNNVSWLFDTLNVGELKMYRIQLTDDLYAFETHLGTLTDTYMYLYGPNDPTLLITSDDDSGAGYGSLIKRQLNTPYPDRGTYYIKIGSYSISQSGNFWIKAYDIRADDIAASWTGVGTYLKFTEAGTWNVWTSWATRVALGDFNNDGRADLVATFSDGYLYVKDTATGAWTLLTSAPNWFAMGDTNQDGHSDLIGAWSSGVFVRDGATGDWWQLTTPTSQLAMYDMDADGYADFAGTYTDGALWIKYMRTGTWLRLTSSPTWFALGDIDGDRYGDVIGSWADGVWIYYSNHWGTYASPYWYKLTSPAGQIATGDLDSDLRDDILATFGGTLWVRYSASGTWAQVTSTPATFGTGRTTQLRTYASGGVPQPLQTGIIPDELHGGAPRHVVADLSDRGPGGANFRYRVSDNIVPGSKIDVEKQILVNPQRIHTPKPPMVRGKEKK